jgi:hypothetical protein
MSEWGKILQEWSVNPHNVGFSHINRHVPSLTLGSLRSLLLSTWISFLSPKELRITRFFPNLSLLGIYYNIPLEASPQA